LSNSIRIGDLVKSALHVGVGLILDIIHPEEVNNPSEEDRFLDEPIAEVYWTFPDPIDGRRGWEDGKDYEYLAQLTVITDENKAQ